MKYIYLASPYSHPDPAVRVSRFEMACKKAAQYAAKGIAVFSPIAHSHPISGHMAPEDCMNGELWMKMDLPLLKDAHEMHILCIEGWRSSKGIARETAFAEFIGIPVRQVFLDVEP